MSDLEYIWHYRDVDLDTPAWVNVIVLGWHGKDATVLPISNDGEVYVPGSSPTLVEATILRFGRAPG